MPTVDILGYPLQVKRVSDLPMVKRHLALTCVWMAKHASDDDPGMVLRWMVPVVWLTTDLEMEDAEQLPVGALAKIVEAAVGEN